MGCLKIPYDKEEALAQNWKIFRGGVGKKCAAEKKRVSAYRYGFNGMEKDRSSCGCTGDTYTTEFRQYDARVGRWWSRDPAATLFADLAPYQFSMNSPAKFNDPKGDCPLWNPKCNWYKYYKGVAKGGLNNLVSSAKLAKDLAFNPEAQAELVVGTAKAVVSIATTNNPVFGDKLAEFSDEYLETDLVETSRGINESIEGKVTQLFTGTDEEQGEVAGEIILGLVLERGTEKFLNSGLIKKSSSLSQVDRLGNFDYTISNGRISFKNGMNAKGQFDVVVTKEGKLLIGDGHLKMSGNATHVKAAGTITIGPKGKITSITNNSGHFKSGSKGLQNLQESLESKNLITKDTPSLNVGIK